MYRVRLPRKHDTALAESRSRARLPRRHLVTIMEVRRKAGSGHTVPAPAGERDESRTRMRTRRQIPPSPANNADIKETTMSVTPDQHAIRPFTFEFPE